MFKRAAGSHVKVAIVGPGAVGGAVSAHLATVDGIEQFLCARTPLAFITLETEQGRLFSKPRVHLTLRGVEVADWVIVATKAYDNSRAAAWLPPMTGDRTRVAVLQNGVDHVERFAPYFNRDRILETVVDVPVDRIAPGHLRERRPGLICVPDTDAGRDFCALFQRSSLRVQTAADFVTAAWRKLCFNSAGAVSAIALSRDAVTHHGAACDLARLLAAECAAVGRAEGAVLAADIVEEVLEDLKRPNAGVNSLLADRLAGRPMEVHERNGIIVQKGAKHRIPTPANAFVADFLGG
ncbi:MAG: 2-dehydropantoate 2-reductase [Candidatus Eremiobacteraeota bacterium]|nr:2-dehydropantoate 2-reductase [Candidatus Eremiobacteraeota bacterium]